MEQAGVYIAQNKCGLLGYLTAYREESNERSEILRANPGSFFLHKETVVASWALSFRKIRESQPAALEMLRLCAFLHIEIPEELIKEAAKYCGEEIQSVVKSFSRFNAALRKILDYSLIKRSPDTKQLTIHKLVQEVLRMEMNENEKCEYVKKLVKALNNAFTETDFTGWEICSRIINHVQVVLQFIKEMKINIPESAQLMNKAGVYLFNRARFNEAEDIFRSILSGNIDTTSSEIAHASCNLAELLEETGHYNEGIELAGKALEIFAKLNGAASLEYANCNRVLGLIYESKGDFEKAVPLFLAALDVRSKIFGEEDIRVAVIHNNLGKIFCSTGDYKKAIFYHEKAKTIRESKLPPNHPDLAQTYNNMANIFIKIGKYEIAEELYKRARSIWENAYIDENKSKKHPDIAIAYNHLALCQLHQKKYEEAEVYLEEAVAILKSFGFEHPHLPTTWNNWGVIYHEKGDYEKAIQYYQKAYSIFENLFGDEHLGLIEILTNLGSAFLLQKNYMKAKEIFQHLLKIQERYFGTEHPSVLETRKCLSLIYKELGDIEGQRLFAETLSVAKKI
ncbi:MAG: tetratricopeptide repeat protein [Acidobacteria bacterium]|nr:tetratricopeptide repeat protein [Acidobacteriota bacterium]